MSNLFRTFQTVRKYDAALARHGQWIRWVQAIKCACIDPDSMQPNSRCSVCKGRGRIFRNPEKFDVLDEIVKSDSSGRVYPKHKPVVGTPIVYRGETQLSISANQPSDGSYIQLSTPYPEEFRVLKVHYSFSSLITVFEEDTEVYAPNILRVRTARFSEKGKAYEGSVEDVSRVYNVTRDESYAVSSVSKEYITLDSMGLWETGDILEVDYTYVKPFNFLLNGVSGRLRYNQPYISDEAEAMLVTPHWAKPAPEDLFTALSQEQIGTVVIHPKVSDGNDIVTSCYDLSSLIRVITKNGTDFSTGPGKDVEIFGRNELKWNTTKPSVAYTVQFSYHPTYTSLTNLHTLRTSENKSFVNRINLKMFDKIHDKVQF